MQITITSIKITIKNQFFYKYFKNKFKFKIYYYIIFVSSKASVKILSYNK